MKNRWISALCAVAFIAAGCSESLHVDSPDGKIEVDVDGNGQGFSVLYDGAEVLTVPMIGLKTNARVFDDSLKLQSVSGPENIQEDYMMKTGKRSHCVNEANERIFTFVNPRNETLKLVVRAYDDGIAFRYCLDSISDGEFLTDEFTSYCIAEGKKGGCKHMILLMKDIFLWQIRENPIGRMLRIYGLILRWLNWETRYSRS